MYRSCLVQCMRRFNRLVKKVRKSGIWVICVYGCCGWLVLMLVVLGNV